MTRQTVLPIAIAAAILAVIVASVFIYLRIVRDIDEPSPAEGPATPATAAIEGAEEAPPAAPEIELPALEESDELVRSLAEPLSSHPRFVRWLVPDGLVRRLVASVANVARGESPRTHLRFLEPERGFAASERGDELSIDRRSYARYDVIAEVFTSLDTATVVRLYRQLEPLFDEAYRDLGYPSGDFDEPLAKAIDHLLATPIPTGAVELERRATSYHLADPALEGLSPAQKHFLRMGSSNMRQVHAKLRLMRTALRLPRSDS